MNNSTSFRSHSCGELRLEQVGQTVKLAGFLDNVREVSANLAFAVLRDFYGTTQIVVEDEGQLAQLKALNKESTLCVTGTVRERASKNPKQLTGDIEVVPDTIEVLGRCRHNELPFPISRSREADESTRLKYRYLDLRNSAVRDNIVLRSQVVAALRQAMTDHGFLEITTPILTASSPEGARDYLVPSRKHPGKFYALPQAPQQFKQLLMASGFDKYFQIAPCFRDEDARGDRSPGEFYQLDMEMAYAGQEDVFPVLEDVLPPIFAKYGTYNVASAAPFTRIPYLEAMEKYGSDKPDLRIDLTVTDATEVLASCGFGPFEGNTVKAVPVTGFSATRKQIDKLCADVEVQSGEKVYWFRLDENGEIVGGIAKFVQPIKDQVVAALGLTPNTFVGLTAGKKLTAQKTAGVLIKMLPALAPQHMDKERYEFCWIVDFPMYEIGLTAGKKLTAQKTAGVLIKMLPALAPQHMDKERYEFCWIVDFPMYEIGEESGQLEFCHNPFSMPNGGLEILKKAAAGEVDPLSITRPVPRAHGQGAVRVLLDRGLPHVRDRRGERPAGILPQPLLHAQRRPGNSEEGRRRRSGSPEHHRLPV